MSCRGSVFLTILSLLNFTLSCDEDTGISNTNYDLVESQATACVRGTVTDGFWGKRVNLDGAKIYAIVNGAVVSDDFKLVKNDSSISTLGLDEADVLGEYQFCGVPVNSWTTMNIPIYAKIDGYQYYSGTLTTVRAAPDRNENTSAPGFWTRPIMEHDISVFKLADLIGQNFSVKITQLNQPVENVKVDLLPVGSHFNSISSTTSETGEATFNAEDLAFGKTYSIIISPQDIVNTDGSYKNIGVYSTSFTLGTPVTASGQIVSSTPFSMHLDLGRESQAPKLLTFSGSTSQDENANIVFVFDRNIKVNLNSVKSVVTAISSYGVKDDGTDCAASDHGSPVLTTNPLKVATLVNNSILTVAPNWTTQPTVNQDCKGFSISYTWSSFEVYTDREDGLDIGNSTLLLGSGDVGSFSTVYFTKP